MLDIGLGFLGQPYQKPRPEIVGTVVAPFSKGVVLMGKRDFHPLSANFLMPKWLPSHWANYQEGKASVGRDSRRRRTGASRARSSSPTTSGSRSATRATRTARTCSISAS